MKNNRIQNEKKEQEKKIHVEVKHKGNFRSFLAGVTKSLSAKIFYKEGRWRRTGAKGREEGNGGRGR